MSGHTACRAKRDDFLSGQLHYSYWANSRKQINLDNLPGEARGTKIREKKHFFS